MHNALIHETPIRLLNEKNKTMPPSESPFLNVGKCNARKRTNLKMWRTQRMTVSSEIPLIFS